MLLPDAGMAMNDVQLPSGTGVFPRRASMARLVPAGKLLVQLAAPQLVTPPESNTREVYEPEAPYGEMRSQSTLSAGPPTLKSLTIATMLPLTVLVIVVTGPPSTEKPKLPAFQSMR